VVEEIGSGTVVSADPNWCVECVQAALLECQKVRGNVEDVRWE
jgi:hypothetical protein